MGNSGKLSLAAITASLRTRPGSSPQRVLSRNYAKEYLIRIARGLGGGKSRSQAYGHAKATDLSGDASQQSFKRSEPLEDALKQMKKGVS